jgi:hypothetical protein
MRETSESGYGKVAWDQRLAEHVARDAWLHANRPAERQRERRSRRTADRGSDRPVG